MFPARIQITVDIRNEIQNQRINKGLSLEQLAKPIGKTVSYMSAVENGRIKSMSSKDLIRVFEILFSIDEEESKQRILSFETFNNGKPNIDNSESQSSETIIEVPDKINTYSTIKRTFDATRIDSLTETINAILKKVQKNEPQLIEEILTTTPHNLQFDVGFMLAIWQFPFFLLEELDYQEKQKFLVKLANLLNEHTSANISLLSKKEQNDSSNNTNSTNNDDQSEAVPSDQSK